MAARFSLTPRFTLRGLIMTNIHVTAQRTIDAPAERVYRFLADYREHHPHFLPPAFSDFQVEPGGFGAGTVVRFTLAIGGRRREFRQRVDEPVPGSVLTESDLDSGAVTTFTVTPDGDRSKVQVETAYEGAAGVSGLVERLLASRLLRRLYSDELRRLGHYAQDGR